MTIPITAGNYINLFNSPGNDVTNDNYIVNGVINFNAANFLCTGGIITNTIFNDRVFFDNCNLGNGLKFENCVFEKNISFNGNTSVGYSPDFNARGENILFKKCIIKEILSFLVQNTFQRGIYIEDNCEIEKIKANELAIPENGFHIKNSKIKNAFELNQINCQNSLSLNTVEFEGIIDINACLFSSISFQNLTTKKIVKIHGIKTQALSIEDGEYFEHVKIESVNINANNVASGNLTLIGAKYKKPVEIKYCDQLGNSGGFDKIFIYSNSFTNGISILGSNTPMRNVIISELHFDNLNTLDGEIELNNFHFTDAKFSGTNFKGSIIINNSRFLRLSFFQFYNYGGFQLNNVTSIRDAHNSRIDILNSHFEKTQFVNVHLDSFKKINFLNSNISKISFVDTKWFLPTQIEQAFVANPNDFVSTLQRWFKLAFKNVDITNSELHFHRQSRELYRQLKLASTKQGDNFQSLIFKRNEMSSYKMELKLSKTIFNKDRFIMWLNQSNDYGQNWWRPVWIALLINFFFFFGVVVSQSKNLEASISFTCEDIKQTFSELYHYLYIYWQMINPALLIHRAFKPSDLQNHEIQNGVFFWMIFSKIFMSYFIYQTIAAFRKYSK